MFRQKETDTNGKGDRHQLKCGKGLNDAAKVSPTLRLASTLTTSSGWKPLEQPGCPHPPSNAHRAQPGPAAAFPKFVNQLRRQLRPRCAERMAERNRAAV